jgi:hypothetical protein
MTNVYDRPVRDPAMRAQLVRRVFSPNGQEQPKEAKVDLHVTMLQNWFDELRRRLPPSGK